MSPATIWRPRRSTERSSLVGFPATASPMRLQGKPVLPYQERFERLALGPWQAARSGVRVRIADPRDQAAIPWSPYETESGIGAHLAHLPHDHPFRTILKRGQPRDRLNRRVEGPGRQARPRASGLPSERPTWGEPNSAPHANVTLSSR